MSGVRCGAVVLGGGPAGEVAVSRLNAQGLKVALVERELVGGECAYRDHMIRNLDDVGQVQAYRDDGVDVFKGDARRDGPGRVSVDGQTLATERIIVATGSDPRIPPIEGLQEAGYWTNREATTLTEVPESVVILGGGPVGVELGQFMRRFGARVTIVDHGDRLIAREGSVVGELIAQTLREGGIDCVSARRPSACSSQTASVSCGSTTVSRSADASCWSRRVVRRGCTTPALRASPSRPIRRA